MKTIHDEAAERVALAETYAKDGDFISAARIYNEVADMYGKRHNEMNGLLNAQTKVGKPSGDR